MDQSTFHAGAEREQNPGKAERIVSLVSRKGKNFLSANYPRIYGTDKKCSRAVHSGEDYTYALKRHPILAGRVHVAGRHFEGTPKLFDTPGALSGTRTGEQGRVG